MVPSTPTVELSAQFPTGEPWDCWPWVRRPTDDAEYLFLNPYDATTNSSLGIGTADLTTNPPSAGVTLATGNGATNFITGPDGCVYAAAGDGVFKITDSAGACNYAAPSQPPSLVLAPPTVSPNPAQGTSQTFTASFHFTDSAPGNADLSFR